MPGARAERAISFRMPTRKSDAAYIAGAALAKGQSAMALSARLAAKRPQVLILLRSRGFADTSVVSEKDFERALGALSIDYKPNELKALYQKLAASSIAVSANSRRGGSGEDRGCASAGLTLSGLAEALQRVSTTYDLRNGVLDRRAEAHELQNQKPPGAEAPMKMPPLNLPPNADHANATPSIEGLRSTLEGGLPRISSKVSFSDPEIAGTEAHGARQLPPIH